MPRSDDQDNVCSESRTRAYNAASRAIGALQLLLDRGEHLDWFSSTEIMIYVAVIAAMAWMYVVHTRLAANPFFSSGLFRDRNLVTSLVFIFFIGIILLATMALLPPYMQNLMGYPVLDVGILMAPRGFGTMAAMMIVGRLMNRVDARLLILLGLSCTIISLHQMSQFSTFVPAQTLVWTGVLQGFGLGFIFVPLSTIAYSTLNPAYRAEAAGVFSLSRNMGSSVGISLVMTALSRNLQINHAYLTENITPGALNGEHWQMLPEALGVPRSGVLAMVDAEITRQAATISYINDFVLMMWVVVASVPLILLLRNPSARTA